jgi:hypothetical protein
MLFFCYYCQSRIRSEVDFHLHRQITVADSYADIVYCEHCFMAAEDYLDISTRYAHRCNGERGTFNPAKLPRTDTEFLRAAGVAGIERTHPEPWIDEKYWLPVKLDHENQEEPQEQ